LWLVDLAASVEYSLERGARTFIPGLLVSEGAVELRDAVLVALVENATRPLDKPREALRLRGAATEAHEIDVITRCVVTDQESISGFDASFESA
jgi:hypothetical protein